MKIWLAVVIACAGCAALKLAGFVVPSRLLESGKGLAHRRRAMEVSSGNRGSADVL